MNDKNNIRIRKDSGNGCTVLDFGSRRSLLGDSDLSGIVNRDSVSYENHLKISDTYKKAMSNYSLSYLSLF